MELEKDESKQLCLIKWDHAKDTGCTPGELLGWLYKNHYDIYRFNSQCAYCEMDEEKENNRADYIECSECPLYILWGMGCGSKVSPWRKWKKAMNKKTRKKYATIIYNDIKKS